MCLVDAGDACFNASKTVIIVFEGVVALMIAMVSGCPRSRSLKEVVRFSEVSLELWPRLVFFFEPIPLKQGCGVEPCLGDCSDRLVLHLFNCEWWPCDYCRHVAFLKPSKEIFNGLRCMLPWRVE